MIKLKLNYSGSNILPNNFLAEQAVLNILLTNSYLIKTTIPKLKIESFYFEPHYLIYSSIVELSNNNKIVNTTTVITDLENKNLLLKIGGIERILNIIKKFEIFSDLETYIEYINEKYLRRLLIQLGQQSIVWGYTSSLEINELLDKTEQAIYNLNQQKLTQKIYSAAEIIDDIYNELKFTVEKNKPTGFLTAFKDLDSILQGFESSDLIIVAGRPSMGKTAFALNLGKNLVTNYKIPLIIFSLEMSRQQTIYRLISTDSLINFNRIKNAKLNTFEWETLSNSMKRISELPIFIEDDPNLDTTEIKSKLRKLLFEKNKNAIVIIDYLQLMKSKINFENRSQEVSYLTRNLKIIAKEFNVPIIALSQLSRNVESRINKRPLLSDLRESGCIGLLSSQINSNISWTPSKLISLSTENFNFKGIKPSFFFIFENKKTIILTSNHKILTLYGWKRIHELDQSSKICGLVKLEKNIEYKFFELKTLKYLGLKTVYDKTVQGYHNYFQKNFILHNSIEQDADIVILLYRDDYYKDNTKEEQIIEFIIAKHRNGPVGSIKLNFYPNFTLFKNL